MARYSKATYEMVANLLAEEKRAWTNDVEGHEAARLALATLTLRFAQVFEGDNERFDTARFTRAASTV